MNEGGGGQPHGRLAQNRDMSGNGRSCKNQQQPRPESPESGTEGLVEAAHDRRAGVLPDARGKEVRTGGEEEEVREGRMTKLLMGIATSSRVPPWRVQPDQPLRRHLGHPAMGRAH